MESENEMGMEELENIEEPEQPDTPAVEPTEAELAEEALEARKEAEDLVPATVVAKQRARARAAELEAAELRGKLSAQQKPAEKEKSPLELAAQEQGCDIKEVVIDGGLYEKQKAFEKKQAEEQAHQSNVESFKKAAKRASEEMSDEVYGKGLGLDALQGLGGHLLDELDHQRIFRAGENCGKEAMKILRRKIIDAGGQEAKVLKSRIQAHKTQAKPKTETRGKSEQKEETIDSDVYLETMFEGL